MSGKSNRYDESGRRRDKSSKRSARGDKYAAAKEKNAAERKVVSYEDVPIDEYGEVTPIQPEVIKKLLKVLLIILACVVVLLIALNWENLSPENISRFIQYDLLGVSQGEGYPTDVNGNEITAGNFTLMDEKTPVYVSDTSVVLLNDNAGFRQNLGQAYANPILQTSRNYALVYNAGGTGLRIFSHSESLHDINIIEKIFCADISDSGAYVTVTQTDDYLAKLTAYTKDKKEKYEYGFADYYINTVSIDSSGTRAIVSGVSAKNGSLMSAVYILDFSREEYVAKYEITDNTIYDVKIFDNGNAAAIGKKESYFFDIENNKKKVIEYDSRTITNYDMTADNGIAISLARYPDGRDCDVLTIKPDSSESSIVTGLKVESVSLSGNNAAVSTGNAVYLYSQESGNIISQSECTQSIKKIKLANDNVLYALCASTIQKVDFNSVDTKS